MSSSSSPSSTSVTPLFLPDPSVPTISIHEDIFRILTTASASQAAEDRRHLHNFWATFVFPFFGVEAPVAPALPCPWLLSEGHFRSVVEASVQDRTPTKVVYGTAAVYLFFRFYQLLYERLWKVQRIRHRARNLKSSGGLGSSPAAGTSPKSPYKSFVWSLQEYIAGRVTEDQYENQLLDWFGPQATFLCTMKERFRDMTDQVLACVHRPLCLKALQLFRFQYRESVQWREEVYHQQGSRLLHSESEKEYYKITFLPASTLKAQSDPRSGGNGLRGGIGMLEICRRLNTHRASLRHPSPCLTPQPPTCRLMLSRNLARAKHQLLATTGDARRCPNVVVVNEERYNANSHSDTFSVREGEGHSSCTFRTAKRRKSHPKPQEDQAQA